MGLRRAIHELRPPLRRTHRIVGVAADARNTSRKKNRGQLRTACADATAGQRLAHDREIEAWPRVDSSCRKLVPGFDWTWVGQTPNSDGPRGDLPSGGRRHCQDTDNPGWGSRLGAGLCSHSSVGSYQCNLGKTIACYGYLRPGRDWHESCGSWCPQFRQGMKPCPRV